MLNTGHDKSAVIHVAVGVIRNKAGHILVSRRPSHVHQPDLWEFPGGKLEAGERVEHALIRELKEELGIIVQSSFPFLKLNHNYGDKQVCLDVHCITSFLGEPEGREGQAVKWIEVADLIASEFPAANYPIIQALKLPEIIQITGEFKSLEDLLQKSSNAIEAGITLIHFRAHHLTDQLYIQYARELLVVCNESDVNLILNRDPQILDTVDASGLHLASKYLNALQQRTCGEDKLFSVACHNLHELSLAATLNADYCFLSPVNKAISHMSGEALGWDQFSHLLAQINIPAYALGGMNSALISLARQNGAIGVAQVSEFWK